MRDDDVRALYEHRFSKEEQQRKNSIWREIVLGFLQNFVPRDAVFVDAACGFGEAINHITAQRKIGIDLNPDSKEHLNQDVEFFQGDSTSFLVSLAHQADVVFASNFLEHLPNRSALEDFLASVRTALKPNGRFLILGPNLHYLPGAYWDFWDHQLGLTHLSLTEVLSIHGFSVERCIDRFLPYSTKSALPTHPLLVRWYLRVPLAWKILGKQFFLSARPTGPDK